MLIKDTNENSTKSFPFVALYPESYYNFPMYEVKFFDLSDLSKPLKISISAYLYISVDVLFK